MASTTRADTALYLSLGIDPTREDVLALSMKELARAYKRAALKWHPDKNLDDPSATARFSRIYLAYETLSDPEKRKVYDDNIRSTRLNSKRYEQLDLERRRLRKNLESREKKGEAWGDEAAGVDDAAMERVKAEIERLRTEVSTEKSKHFAAPEADLEHRNKDHCASVGSWAHVSGYPVFRRSRELSFGSLEGDVLAGRNPF